MCDRCKPLIPTVREAKGAKHLLFMATGRTLHEAMAAAVPTVKGFEVGHTGTCRIHSEWDSEADEVTVFISVETSKE